MGHFENKWLYPRLQRRAERGQTDNQHGETVRAVKKHLYEQAIRQGFCALQLYGNGKKVMQHIKNIERLSRNHKEVREQWRIFNKERGGDICVLDMCTVKDLIETFNADLMLIDPHLCVRGRAGEQLPAADGHCGGQGKAGRPDPWYG